MFNQSSKKPLLVELMDISKQNEAILKFFISGVGRKVFKMANNAAEIEAYILDYDFPGAKAHWEAEYSGTHKPCIILSTYDPDVENAVWVGKPLSSKKLIEAASAIKELLAKAPQPLQAHDDADEAATSVEIMPQKPVMDSVSLVDKVKTIVPKEAVIKEKLPTAVLVTPDVVSEQGNDDATASLEVKPAMAESDTVKAESQANTKVVQKPKTKEQIAEEEANREKRWKDLCGSREDVTSPIPDELRYIPENFYIGKLTGAVRLAKQSQQIVEIKAEDFSTYVLPQEHLIYTDIALNEADFAKFCREKVKFGDMNLHILSSIETGKLQLKMSTQPETTHSLESFLWTASLLVSQGRLPASVDLDKRTALKYWPSFARIEAFPYSMRIAALWHHSPDTLMEISKKLGIPQRYVFAFYNGADALDLIECNPKRVKQQMKAKPTKGGGLISRLFKRLLSGGSTPS